MSFGIIFAVLFLAIIVVGIGVGLAKARKQRSRRRALIGTVMLLIGVLGLILVPGSFHTVQAGQIAVVKHLGEARTARTPGTYFDFWVTEKYEYYDSKVQNMDITTQAYSKDAQTMSIAMNIQYKIDEGKVIDIQR